MAINFQSRAWIDEIWVVLNPAYQLLTGVGHLSPHDWVVNQQRSWIPPYALFVYLKILGFLGIKNGVDVLAMVRLAITLASAAGFFAFTCLLARRFSLKYPPLAVVVALFFSPQFVHYSTLADLSVLAMPFVLVGLTLIFWEAQKPKASPRVVLGCFLLAVGGGGIRFQFGLISLAVWIYLLAIRQFKVAAWLVAAGLAVLVIDFGFSSYIYGEPVLPIYRYAYADLFKGAGNDAGVRPFYYAFEILWRFMMEPAFLIAFLFLPSALMRVPALAIPSFVLALVFTVIGHKEFRYFYGPAVLLSGVGAAAFQKWFEERVKRQAARACVVLVLLSFVFVASWRGVKKVRWGDYEIPSKLETFAGTQRDAKGLLVFGWAGIYTGGHYTFHRSLPYKFIENEGQVRQLLKDGGLSSADFNYLIVPDTHGQVCLDEVKREGGGVLFRCTEVELMHFLESMR
ncbi:MAG: hypothetical protein AB1540_05545 [Bdellovibrionota bacterium]